MQPNHYVQWKNLVIRFVLITTLVATGSLGARSSNASADSLQPLAQATGLEPAARAWPPRETAPMGLPARPQAPAASGVWVPAAQWTSANGQGYDYYGFAIAVDGGTAVVGAYAHPQPWDPDNYAGQAYIYQLDLNGAWNFVKAITGTDTTRGDNFGVSVAINGDRIVVGAQGARIGTDAGQGAAYVFERNYGGVNNWGQTKKLVASDGVAGDNFGLAVSVSGSTIVVGAPVNDVSGSGGKGYAYVFDYEVGGPGNWGQRAKLIASDGASRDQFGHSVSLNGDTVAVGAWKADASTVITDTGAVYVFGRNQGAANQWGQVKKLTASDGAASDSFGASVSLSQDTLVVGPDMHAVGTKAGQGAAYVFERNQGGGNNWGQVKQLVASDGAQNDYFGRSVSINGDRIAVGSPYDDIGDNYNQGSAYVFERNQGGFNQWGQTAKVIAADGAYYDLFGTVAINGNLLAVGAPWKNVQTSMQQGKAYMFGWQETATLVKTVNYAFPAPGQRITYTLTITNSTATALSQATVSDTIPAGMSLAGPITLQTPGAGTVGTPPNVVTGLGLAPGQTAVIRIPVIVGTGAVEGQLIQNTATLISLGGLVLQTSSVNVTVSHPNQRPIANAGPDQTVVIYASPVRLNGSGSYDPDNNLPLSYGWTQVGGTPVALSSRTAVSPTFTAPGTAGDLTFSLIVTDSLGMSSAAADTVVVRVSSLGLAVQSSTPTVLGQRTYFTATVQTPGAVVYQWNFGDGSGTVYGANPYHIYPHTGFFTATVVASQGMAVDTATTRVEVTTNPKYYIFLPMTKRH